MAWWGLTLPFLASSLLAFPAVAFGQLSNDCSPSPPEERKKKKNVRTHLPSLHQHREMREPTWSPGG